MRTNNLPAIRMTAIAGALALMFAARSAYSLQCPSGTMNVTTNGASCTTLLAGQTIDAGDVCVSMNGDSLEVTYTTTGGWQLLQTHAWVGSQLSDMPQTKKGNPKVGNFPYHSGDITGLTSYTETIPLVSLVSSGYACDLCGTTFIVAAHASLRKDNGDGTFRTETGWGGGQGIVDKGSWATYSTIGFTCAPVGPPTVNEQCETAYATSVEKGSCTSNDPSCNNRSDSESSCFITTSMPASCNSDDVYLSNKWGWQIGPIVAGTSRTYNLHAGAGQCNPAKGFVAGTVGVTYDGTNLTVAYDVTKAGKELGSVHVYAGYAGSCTSAPGQFTILGNSGVFENACDQQSFTVDASRGATGFDGREIYIIAHAEICPSVNACVQN